MTWQVIIALTAASIVWVIFLYQFAFFKWIRPSLEGEDGKASFKRLVPYTLTMLVVYMVLADKIPEADRYITSIALLLTSALYAGIVTMSQVIALKNGDKLTDDIKSGDNVTITKE